MINENKKLQDMCKMLSDCCLKSDFTSLRGRMVVATNGDNVVAIKFSDDGSEMVPMMVVCKHPKYSQQSVQYFCSLLSSEEYRVVFRNDIVMIYSTIGVKADCDFAYNLFRIMKKMAKARYKYNLFIVDIEEYGLGQ